MRKKKRAIFLYLLFSFFAPSVLANSDTKKGAFATSFQRLKNIRQRLHEWDRTVRGFRLGHHFHGYIGQERGSYRVNGSLIEEGTGQSNHFAHDFDTKASYWAFQYSYHIPLAGSFGYYLGSTIGLIYDESSSDGELQVDRMMMLPGVTLGLVYNFSPAIRVFGGVNAQLVRFERFQEKHSGEAISPTTTYFNGHALVNQIGLDLFFQLHWAVRVHREDAVIKNNKVFGASGSELGVSRRKKAERYLFGILYHII